MLALSPLWISLKVALPATIFTFVLGICAARTVVKLKHGQAVIDGLFTLPLVLPPTVVGFFLLLAFGKNSLVGQFFSQFGFSFIFSWQGAVIASTVVSFPLMYRTVRGAFEQINPEYLYAARTLGMTERKIFRKIMLPLAWPGILAGTILSFTRALGEFGATIMIAGNIPGKTQTMSVAVYTAVQAGDRESAFLWVMIIVCFSFVMMLAMNFWTSFQVRLIQQKGAAK
ncbi:molybdate ABC transporter permease subunit [Anaerostipes caccae]|uniref:molybdate ABC transporter permease subunit n=1 Tax=Anaerostipes caccae TaxID=105841 RepID=UPI001A92D9C8|nr:molybdate ABC transporter permease subunit [Anaerostipes caccae]